MDEERYYEEYEIDLRQYIKLLWNSKWFIIGLVIVAVLSVGLYYKYAVEPEYEARSTLLILPSIYTTSLEAPSFPVDTYVSLAQTDAIKGKIIKELNLETEDEDPLPIARLENMLDIEVLARETTVDEETYRVPLMTFKVRGKNPEQIADIANVWADNFIEDSKSMRTNEVQEVSSVINKQFQDTKTKLNDAKEMLRKFKEETRLSLAEDRLKSMRTKLSDYNQKLLDLRTEIGSEKAKLEELNNNISALEIDGRWIGDLYTERDTIKGEIPETLLVINARERYQQASEAILDFRTKNNLELLELQIANKEQKIEDYFQNMSELQANLEKQKTENKFIVTLLEEEPDTWKLQRSMSEDSLWDNVLNPEQLDILKGIQLTEEVINPVFRELEINKARNRVGEQSLPERIKYYQQEIEKEENKLTLIQAERARKKQELELLQNNLQHYQPIYKDYSKEYQNLIASRMDSRLKIDSLQSELRFYEEASAELEAEIKELQNNIWENEIRQEELQQQIDDYQQTYEKLAEKREEARITEAQRTSDVKFVAEAFPPSRPLSQNIKLNMAITAILALMSGVFIVFFREFLQEEEDGVEMSG